LQSPREIIPPMKPFLRKWGICILLFLATTLNYLDRQTLAILAPTIQDEMSLDNTALGWLFAVFYYTYAFSQFGVGALLDRYNLRWTYGLAVVAWSAACALTGLAGGFAGLVLFRLLLGIAESANWPAALRVVSRLLPPSERSMGNGIFTSGTSVGALIAPVLILTISAYLGWRWTFAAIGSLGALWFAAWLFFTRSPRLAAIWQPDLRQGLDHPNAVARDSTDERPASTSPNTGLEVYRQLLKNRMFWQVFAVTILVNPCLYFNLNWLPTYFVQEHGMAKEETKWILTAIYIGLDLGYLVCGASTMWLVHRGLSVSTARRCVFLVATLVMLSSAAIPWVRDLNTVVLLLTAVNFAIGAWITMYLTMASEVSRNHVSTAAGLLGGSGSLFGALAMWAVGKVTQATGSFSVPMVLVAVAACLASFAGLAVTRKIPVPEPQTVLSRSLVG
jgi:ACS family hexuronate transporter-like MFS transporter